MLLLASSEALVSGCGTKSDLIIGRNATALPNAGGPAQSGGSAGEAAASPGGQAGAPSDPADCGVDATTPSDGLLHRYSFDGTGTQAKDSVGSADGQLYDIPEGNALPEAGPGAVLDGSGQLVLSGSGYVNLPNGLISALQNVTVVTWVKWSNGAGYQRIFDFGLGGDGEDQPNQDKPVLSYLALSPWGGASRLQLLTKGPAGGEVRLQSTGELKGGLPHQVAVVVVGSSHVELYLDAAQVGRADITFALSDIQDVNDWLGRSQYAIDPPFTGSIDEFRIYGRQLSACEIEALNVAGPDAL